MRIFFLLVLAAINFSFQFWLYVLTYSPFCKLRFLQQKPASQNKKSPTNTILYMPGTSQRWALQCVGPSPFEDMRVRDIPPQQTHPHLERNRKKRKKEREKNREIAAFSFCLNGWSSCVSRARSVISLSNIVHSYIIRALVLSLSLFLSLIWLIS